MTANQNGFVLIKKPWATFPLNSINKNQLPCLTLSVETGELFIFLPSKMKYDANPRQLQQARPQGGPFLNFVVRMSSTAANKRRLPMRDEKKFPGSFKPAASTGSLLLPTVLRRYQAAGGSPETIHTRLDVMILAEFLEHTVDSDYNDNRRCHKANGGR